MPSNTSNKKKNGSSIITNGRRSKQQQLQRAKTTNGMASNTSSIFQTFKPTKGGNMDIPTADENYNPFLHATTTLPSSSLLNNKGLNNNGLNFSNWNNLSNNYWHSCRSSKIIKELFN